MMRHEQHAKYAGRVPAGLQQPVVLKKNGVRHVSSISSSGIVSEWSVGWLCFLSLLQQDRVEMR